MLELFENTEKSRLEDFDNLFEATLGYEDSHKYEKFLKDITSAKFRKFSLFNSGLIARQCPGARYLCEISEWKQQWCRRIKVNARPIIYLNFKPVGYLFELVDTFYDESLCKTNNNTDKSKELKEYLKGLEQIENQFNPQGRLRSGVLDDIKENIKYCGIFLDDNMTAGISFAGSIRMGDDFAKVIRLPIIKEKGYELFVDYPAEYLLSVNKSSKGRVEESFATICHELGHLFCGHLGLRQDLELSTQEFEAESVAYIVCKRLNIEVPSSEYLSGYLNRGKEIPKISIARVLDAADEIEKMFRKANEINYKKKSYNRWWWYKTNKDLKEEIDEKVRKYRHKKENFNQSRLLWPQ